MKEWDEKSEQVSHVTRDTEKAKALLRVIVLREKNVNTMDHEEFTTLIVEGYYEIMKELITALMSIDGWKTVSHELLISYLVRFYKEFSQTEVYIIDQLRKTRNDIAYRGVMIRPEYLKRNKKTILQTINKLKKIVQMKLKTSEESSHSSKT